MNLTKTKEKIKDLIDENNNEDLLNEVRRILEFSAEQSINEISDEQKRDLDELEMQYKKGELQSVSWDELKNQLLGRLKK